MDIPCCFSSACFDPANPFENLSSEPPDPQQFIGYNSGWGGNEPPIGSSWSTLGCVSQCVSTVSQADADLCAQNQQIECTVTNGTTLGPGGGGGWRDPNGNPVPLFKNSAQRCTIVCPDGLPFNYVIPANQYTALSQAQADAIAQSIACTVGQSERMCLNNIVSGVCVGDDYVDIIETEGGTPPITYRIVSGSLPPGFTAESLDELSMDITGTCNTPGNYSFTVRAIDRFGLFMVKTYTIAVLGITNTPTDATKGTAYSFQFTAAGGTEPYSFSCDPNALPDGITLSDTGLLSGTPTVDGDFTFAVTVSDSSP